MSTKFNVKGLEFKSQSDASLSRALEEASGSLEVQLSRVFFQMKF